jgi:hypothetical protein
MHAYLSEIYRDISIGIEVNLGEVYKVYEAGKDAYFDGECVIEAMKEALEKHRKRV